MKKIDNVPWEMLAGLAAIMGLILVPILIGMLIVKLYRSIKPLSNKEDSILLGGYEKKDGFLTVYFCGLIPCMAVIVFLYTQM